MAQWKILETDANLQLMAEVLQINEITAKALALRGIRSKKTAMAFLSPSFSNMNPVISSKPKMSGTTDMKDAEKAFKRITEAAKNGERVMIYGDYDADGVMGTVILCKALRLFFKPFASGAEVQYYIPHREEEGYGLNSTAVRALKETETDLLITCDNGITALNEIKEACALGMDVIVIDHHEPGFIESSEGRYDVIPEALAVIDPKQSACPYPFKQLCAAGLAFRLMDAFFAYAGRNFSPLRGELLALAAVATVCDIVDLLGDNRILVKNGLDILNANKHINPGLGQLIKLKGYTDKPIDTFTLGFVLGPCINATGRLESAEMAVRLLLSEDTTEQSALAARLSALNEERKSITASCIERMLANLSAKDSKPDKVLVLVDNETHESVAGIVAGRVKDTLHHPAIVLTRCSSEQADVSLLKGSGRSIEGYNIFEALYENRSLFLRFGGHAMAAGLTLREENVPILRQRLNENCTLTDSDFTTTLNIDAVLPLTAVTLKLAEELAILRPFGKANHEPLFCSYGLNVTALRVINEKNTLIFTFGTHKGIAFGLNEYFTEILREHFDERTYRNIMSGFFPTSGLILDAAYNVETNTFNGQTSVQMRIKDFRITSFLKKG